jgi:hypothetical protein
MILLLQQKHVKIVWYSLTDLSIGEPQFGHSMEDILYQSNNKIPVIEKILNFYFYKNS